MADIRSEIHSALATYRIFRAHRYGRAGSLVRAVMSGMLGRRVNLHVRFTHSRRLWERIDTAEMTMYWKGDY